MLRPNLTPNSVFFTLKLISCYNIITLVAYYFQNIRMMIMPKKYLYSITVATITFLTVSTYQVANGQEFVTDGLVLYYSFDKDTVTKNKVKDLSGEGNDGKIEGKLKSMDGPPKGDFGQAFEYEGDVDCYVEIPALGDW